MFVRVFTIKLLPTFPYCPLWKKVTYASQVGSYVLITWGCHIYINCLKLFCMRDLSLLPYLYIYWIIYLYQYGLVDIIYFILWVIVQYSYILFCCWYYSSFGHWEIFQWPPVPLWHTPINVDSMEKVLETMICVLGVLITAGVSFLLYPFIWQRKGVYVHVLICEYMHFYKHFYM